MIVTSVPMKLSTPTVAFALGLAFNGAMLMLNRAFFSLQTAWIPTWVALGNLEAARERFERARRLRPPPQQVDVGFGLARKADDEGGADRKLRADVAPAADAIERLLLVSGPAHGLQHRR